MNNKLLRIAALVVLVVVVLGMIYGRRILGWRNQRDDRGTAQVSAGERKVLYYYDAMNPQHHYDKPGKAPDGMDLVPQYADDSATRNNAVQSSTQSATPGDRKVLFWYDPMHPAYKSDKPGIAPDCGMQLVPRYAGESEVPVKQFPVFHPWWTLGAMVILTGLTVAVLFTRGAPHLQKQRRFDLLQI